MRREKWMSFKEWREEIKVRRNEVLWAIKLLTKALLSGENLGEKFDKSIGKEIKMIAENIDRYGLTDDMIYKAIQEVREEMGIEDKEEINRFFNKIKFTIPRNGKTKEMPPEVGAITIFLIS